MNYGPLRRFKPQGWACQCQEWALLLDTLKSYVCSTFSQCNAAWLWIDYFTIHNGTLWILNSQWNTVNSRKTLTQPDLSNKFLEMALIESYCLLRGLNNRLHQMTSWMTRYSLMWFNINLCMYLFGFKGKPDMLSKKSEEATIFGFSCRYQDKTTPS